MLASWHRLPSHTVVLGHRGARHAHPENTLRAFQAALDEGAVGTEFDVLLSADGVPMVFHDFSLARMTGQRDQRKPSALTAAELESVVLEGGEHIPTLQAVLDWAVAKHALLNIELKSEHPLRDRVAEIVAELLQDYPNASDFALMSSFHPTLVRRFARRQPAVPAALLVDQNRPCLVSAAWLNACHASAVHPHRALLLGDPELRRRVSGAMVNTWTVNDETQAVTLARLGVTSLITDRPGAILAALRRAGTPSSIPPGHHY